MKKRLSFLKEVDSTALQQSIMMMDDAYHNFFKGSGFPKYKSKKNNVQSYRTVSSTTTNPDLDFVYFLICPEEVLSDRILCFRVPGYTAGYVKIENPDALSSNLLTKFTIASVTLFERSPTLSRLRQDLSQEFLDSFIGTEQILEDV